MSRHDDVVDFGSLSERRKLALATFDLCAVCGKPFGQETRWQVSMTREALDHPGATFAEAPVHEICALYSAQVCPFVSSPYARLGDELRRGAKRPDTVYLVGYNRTSSVFGHHSRIQPGTGVLHFEMAGRIGSHEFHTASEATEIYEVALRGDVRPSLDSNEQTLVEILNHPTPENEDAGGVMAGAAWYVGAAFCPDIQDVQGMQTYAEHQSYTKIAMATLEEDDVAHSLIESSGDAATRAAMMWFTTRAGLPEVLHRWRERARARRPFRPDRGTPADSTQRKSRRRAVAASRKQNRRRR